MRKYSRNHAGIQPSTSSSIECSPSGDLRGTGRQKVGPVEYPSPSTSRTAICGRKHSGPQKQARTRLSERGWAEVLLRHLNRRQPRFGLEQAVRERLPPFPEPGANHRSPYLRREITGGKISRKCCSNRVAVFQVDQSLVVRS